jgi:hypothetical protein
MLQRLAGEPEVLNSVAMLPAGGLDLRGQATKDISRDAIYRQERPAREPANGGQPPLAGSWVLGDFRAEPELRESHGRNKDRLVSSESPYIGGRQGASLHVNPRARIN